ncbi:pleckstrin homology domain-containing family D member 1-like isoform X2 [Lineus longissimus]|uniref:pleckstrin homology domain-containing family D member 1-like isoform X2 n=1 Tax=Lineus longissimus TaxID=88925 RepID=UPI00315C6DD4
MPDNEGTFDMRNKCQMHGMLLKKPFGHQSNKWSKRFFMVKDGFLLYYADSEKKEMEKRKFFNIHPKGVIPLGDCQVAEIEEPGHQFAVNIINEDFLGSIILAMETEWEREKWMTILRQAGRITWNNAQMGDVMIQQLENQGLQMAKERQDYFNKFQTEAIALQDEKEKTEQLKQVQVALEDEKRKMEEFMLELKEEQSKLKQVLEETAQAMKKVEEDKLALCQRTESLEGSLKRLAKDKEKTKKKLDEQAKLTRQLSKEKQKYSEATIELNKQMQSIEAETQKLLQEKSLAEERLKQNEEHAKQLEEEKYEISEHADELQSSIKDLIEQKKVTEAELREEVIARLETERRLQNAEVSLMNLDRKLNKKGNKYSQNDKEEMLGNVTHLKSFFEKLAIEAKMDDHKPILMQTTLTARKTFVARAKSKRYQERRKRVQSLKWTKSEENIDCIHLTNSNDSPDIAAVKRSVSMADKDIKIHDKTAPLKTDKARKK